MLDRLGRRLEREVEVLAAVDDWRCIIALRCQRQRRHRCAFMQSEKRLAKAVTLAHIMLPSCWCCWSRNWLKWSRVVCWWRPHLHVRRADRWSRLGFCARAGVWSLWLHSWRRSTEYSHRLRSLKACITTSLLQFALVLAVAQMNMVEIIRSE